VDREGGGGGVEEVEEVGHLAAWQGAPLVPPHQCSCVWGTLQPGRVLHLCLLISVPVFGRGREAGSGEGRMARAG